MSSATPTTSVLAASADTTATVTDPCAALPTPPRLCPAEAKWVRREVIRLKALLPHAGCRTIAHTLNRQWKSRRLMTVSKTYVADLCRRHQYLIYEARRKL
jgi:hypothetical protein